MGCGGGLRGVHSVRAAGDAVRPGAVAVRRPALRPAVDVLFTMPTNETVSSMLAEGDRRSIGRAMGWLHSSTDTRKKQPIRLNAYGTRTFVFACARQMPRKRYPVTGRRSYNRTKRH